MQEYTKNELEHFLTQFRIYIVRHENGTNIIIASCYSDFNKTLDKIRLGIIKNIEVVDAPICFKDQTLQKVLKQYFSHLQLGYQ